MIAIIKFQVIACPGSHEKFRDEGLRKNSVHFVTYWTRVRIIFAFGFHDITRLKVSIT